MSLKLNSDDIVTFEDGYKYFWPKDFNGALSSNDLRSIADQLDELNKDWNQLVNDYFTKGIGDI